MAAADMAAADITENTAAVTVGTADYTAAVTVDTADYTAAVTVDTADYTAGCCFVRVPAADMAAAEAVPDPRFDFPDHTYCCCPCL